MFGRKILRFFAKTTHKAKNQRSFLNQKSKNTEKVDTRETSKKVRKVLGYSFLGIVGCMAYSEIVSKKMEIIYDRDNEVSSQLLYKMDFLNKGY